MLIYLFAEKYIENEGKNIYIYIYFYFVGLAKIILKAGFWGLAKRTYAYYLSRTRTLKLDRSMSLGLGPWAYNTF